MTDVKVLTKKIKKVEQLLASIEEDKGKDSKEYRADQRKLEEYNSQIESTGAETSGHDDNDSVMTGDLSLDEDLDAPASSMSLGSMDSMDESIDGSGRNLPTPVVFCGPSGVGKGTLIDLLMKQFPKDHFGFSVSHTTRGPREGEVDGKHYHFTTVEAIKKEIDAGKFVEYAEVCLGSKFFASHIY